MCLDLKKKKEVLTAWSPGTDVGLALLKYFKGDLEKRVEHVSALLGKKVELIGPG